MSTLTPDECKRLRVALIFGDPSLEGHPDPKLEAAKAKLLEIEKGQASLTPGDKLAEAVERATAPGRTRTHAFKSLPAALRRYREATKASDER